MFTFRCGWKDKHANELLWQEWAGGLEREAEGGRERENMCDVWVWAQETRQETRGQPWVSILVFQLIWDRVYHCTLGILGYLVAILSSPLSSPSCLLFRSLLRNTMITGVHHYVRLSLDSRIQAYPTLGPHWTIPPTTLQLILFCFDFSVKSVVCYLSFSKD